MNANAKVPSSLSFPCMQDAKNAVNKFICNKIELNFDAIL